jgi:hypothetical protein
MSAARARPVGRIQRIQGHVALIFLALGSIGSFALGHEIAGSLAVPAIYAGAAQDQLPLTLRASGALGAGVSLGGPSRKTAGGAAHRTSSGHAHGQPPSIKGGQSHSGQSGTSATPGGQTGQPGSSAGNPSPGSPPADGDDSSTDQPDTTGTLPSSIATPTPPSSSAPPSPDLALDSLTGIAPAAAGNIALPTGATPS